MLNGLSAMLLAAVWSLPTNAGDTRAAEPPHADDPGNPPVVVIDEPVPLVLVRIAGGRFRMGDTQGIGQADERPVREVRVGDFWMMRTEVTRRMFAPFAEETAYETGSKCWVFASGWTEKDGLSWQNPGFEQGADHPVTCINWHDARAFADWLASKTGVAFRLPTEAEWEYAARAGADNVWKWVEDCWNDSYRDAPTDGGAWLSGDCARRGFRGGGYGDIPRFARSTLRNRSNAKHRKDDVGFRLVVDEPVALTGRP